MLILKRLVRINFLLKYKHSEAHIIKYNEPHYTDRHLYYWQFIQATAPRNVKVFFLFYIKEYSIDRQITVGIWGYLYPYTEVYFV
jgi:hypothetical protein